MKIPSRYKAGLSLLASIPEASYMQILEAMKVTPSTFLSNRELSAWMASEVKSVNLNDVEKILDSLTSLYRLRLRTNVPISRLATDVDVAARESIDGFKVTADASFKDRLASLLALESLNIITVKAQELQTDSERTFCEAKIITDIRPIFGEKVGDTPTAAIIVHTLRIGFHDSISSPHASSSAHQDIYFALDEEDIGKLRKVLERAEEKARSLKSFLESTKVRFVDLS